MKHLIIYIGIVFGTLIGFFSYSYFGTGSLNWGILSGLLFGLIILSIILNLKNKPKRNSH